MRLQPPFLHFPSTGNLVSPGCLERHKTSVNNEEAKRFSDALDAAHARELEAAIRTGK